VADSPRERRSDTTALSSKGERAVETLHPDSEVLNPYRDGKTFASETAPWVGAEQAWRQSILPPPHEEWVNYPEHASAAAASQGRRDTGPKTPLLTDEEIATVLTSLPPPHEPEAPKRTVLPQLLKYAAVAAFTAVSAWAIFAGMSTEKGAETENLSVAAVGATPHSGLPVAAQPPVETEQAPSEPSVMCGQGDPDEPLESRNTMVFDAPISEPTQSVAAKQRTRVPDRKKSRAPVAAEPAVAAPEETPSPVVAPSAQTSDEVQETVAAATDELEATPVLQESELASEGSFNKDNPYEPDPSFNTANPYEGTAEASAPATEKAESQPAIPRAEIERVMSGIAPHVARCGTEENDRIVLEVWVSGATGRVTEAFVADKDHANTAVGICASKAVRLAKFPKFSGERLTVKYPFSL